MSLNVQCGQCREKYTVPDEWAGKRARCKKCGHQMAISAPTPPAPPAPLHDPLTDLLDDALAAETADAGTTSDPFAASSAPVASSGPLRPLPTKRRRPSGEPTFGGMLLAFVRQQKLITAVILGMCWLILCMVYDLATSGPGLSGIVGMGFLVIGAVIVMGGLMSGTARRDRSRDKAWANRMVAWMIGGIMGIVLTFIVVFVVGRTGMVTNVPALTRVVVPFLYVFTGITLISGLFLFYFILVLLFPKTNIFRIGGWCYVGFTVVIPVVAITAGLMLKAAKTTLEQRSSLSSSAADFDSPKPFERQSNITPPRPARPPSQRPGAPRERHESGFGEDGMPDPFAGDPDHESEFDDMFDSPDWPSDMPGPDSPAESRSKRSDTRPSGFDFHLKHYARQYGAERVVTITVVNLPWRDFGPVVAKVQEVAREDVMPMPTESGAFFAVAPVDDIKAFAKKLDIGKVTKIDTDTRTITVDAGGSR